MQATDVAAERQPKPLLKAPDLLTALRIPLAGAFLLAEGMGVRLGIVFAAAASDFIDGIWARRIGGSRAGPVLDPVCDKLFMAAAFVVVLTSGTLSVVEVIGVVLRDLTAAATFLGTVLLRRPTAVPVRAGGKAVTVFQVLTLIAFAAESSLLRPLAWAAAAISIYAIVDYTIAALQHDD
jgi:phosphatidylglycerophosphate synthase